MAKFIEGVLRKRRDGNEEEENYVLYNELIEVAVLCTKYGSKVHNEKSILLMSGKQHPSGKVYGSSKGFEN